MTESLMPANPARAEVLESFDIAVRVLALYIATAPDREVSGLVDVLPKLKHIRARFAGATKPPTEAA